MLNAMYNEAITDNPMKAENGRSVRYINFVCSLVIYKISCSLECLHFDLNKVNYNAVLLTSHGTLRGTCARSLFSQECDS